MNGELIAGLRAHARGIYTLEAATELLIAHRTWPHHPTFIALTTPDASHRVDSVDPDWPAIVTALDTGALPCSRSEQHMLRVAASMAAGIPIDLCDALTGLDDHNIDLIVTAVLHASGRPQPKARTTR